MEIDLVVFDWSGTVSDDRTPVYEANLRLLNKFGKRSMPFEDWLSTSSLNAAQFLKAQGIDGDDTALSSLYESYLDEVVSDGICPMMFSDAPSVFQRLSSQGKKIAILSAHPESHLQREVDEYDLRQFVSRAIGGVHDKAAHLSALCKEFGTTPEKTLFVGDTVFDMQAAKEAGTFSAAVTTGYHSKELLLTQKPDFIFASLSDIMSIV